jgi:hypothetical protein
LPAAKMNGLQAQPARRLLMFLSVFTKKEEKEFGKTYNNLYICIGILQNAFFAS